ncbi:probable LRR receptor-like serine/threonine-protein kinase At5g37450 [Hibiscus syriacus]|uniref:probable LRR receptor-like serine/threonine-protein kinase At5g37450 n=1 Tax=Hibiscus syriacus TaxID=106335 RepID=UPI0019217AA2|nr:probable LRR receptor-like serine/threonine-protein kinase At5g37450 [Hibiscus syriacus]
MQPPLDKHWKVVKRIVSYLKGTLDHGLFFASKPTGTALVGYSDSDWGTNLDDQRSTVGHELNIQLTTTPVIWYDNISAIAHAVNPVHHVKLKHVELDLCFVREKVMDGLFPINYVSALDQIAEMLVYEFMPNGSLHDLQSDRYRHTLSFPMRLRIALGSAKGTLYLHNEANSPIIHRDIRASNILLDFKFTPKVSDFGISRLAPLPEAEGASALVSTLVKGTPGYLDPEYFLTHKLTNKSDVYSLGIVFLELLTGMLPISHGRNIVRVYCFIKMIIKCCLDDPKQRPTMLEVVRELNSYVAVPGDLYHANRVGIRCIKFEYVAIIASLLQKEFATPHGDPWK